MHGLLMMEDRAEVALVYRLATSMAAIEVGDFANRLAAEALPARKTWLLQGNSPCRCRLDSSTGRRFRRAESKRRR